MEKVKKKNKRFDNSVLWGIVAILLIIIVTVALVAIFKSRLTALVDKLFTVIEKSTSGI